MEAGPAIEIGNKGKNRPDAVALHDRNMERVSCRQFMGDFGGAEYVCFFDGDHFVDDVQGDLQRGSDGFPFIDRGVPVKDLLKHFGVCNQALRLRLNAPGSFARRFCAGELLR